MIVTIKPGKAFGRVKAPPSKSTAHRYLICSALSKKVGEIKGVGSSKDIKATIGCLKALGAKTEVVGNTVKIGGIDFKKGVSSDSLFCNESGSTLRFLIPICLLFEQKLSLYGSERLMERSLSVYADICKSQGIEFLQRKNCVTLNGRLSAGKYSVRGDVSSQFISGLMFALPLLPNDSIIDIEGALESGSYLGLTVKALADFGVRVSRTDEHTIYVKGNQTYRAKNLTVEGDYSNAAFFEALNTIGGNVAVFGLSETSIQGDKVYKILFSRLVRGCPEIDISDCPDLGPILMVVAATHNGAIFTGTHRLKIKESDRGVAMAQELAKFGCKVEAEQNRITVNKCELQAPSVPLLSHNDHRIVMSLAVLCTLTGGTICGAEAVEKSFPDFFEQLSTLGIDL